MKNPTEHEYEIKCPAETKLELMEKYHITKGPLSQALNFKTFGFNARRIRADTLNNYPSRLVSAQFNFLF